MSATNAALYLRSSKDRSDVSIAAQRHELEALARNRDLAILVTYEDVVESGASEDRPAFLELISALRNPRRGWSHLLVYDTSRIARRRHIAQAFKHEAKKRGVTILYAKLPADLDPITEVILESSFEAMDEVHSLMSREKGLMGMRENVRQGFRAGGRAPMGYLLERIPTGAIRDGKPVMKSRLVLGADSERMRKYLKARATGEPRAKLAKDLGFTCNPSTLIGVEWNALTYAGHTVWNVHNEPGKGKKRRPREEWVIQRDTHDALISDAEAEALLAQLKTSKIGQAVSRAKSASSSYLLTGLLVTSDGRPWTGHKGKYYRLKRSDKGPGKLIECEVIDRAVLAQITSDMRSDEFIEGLLDAARAAGLDRDPAKPLRDRIAQLEREKTKAAELALTVEDGGTFTRLIEERSRQIAALKAELAAIEADAALTQAVRALTSRKLRELLFELGGPTEALPSLVEKIILEPDLTCTIHYHATGCLSMASPRGFDGWTPTVSRRVAAMRA